jgi:hypothetical protein
VHTTTQITAEALILAAEALDRMDVPGPYVAHMLEDGLDTVQYVLCDPQPSPLIEQQEQTMTREPRIHRDAIHAWADGIPIGYRNANYPNEADQICQSLPDRFLGFVEDCLYTPHPELLTEPPVPRKNAYFMKAWADGYPVEYEGTALGGGKYWNRVSSDTGTRVFNSHMSFRIAPEWTAPLPVYTGTPITHSTPAWKRERAKGSLRDRFDLWEVPRANYRSPEMVSIMMYQWGRHDLKMRLDYNARVRRLIGDYVAAHLREPNRIDILGDLYMLYLHGRSWHYDALNWERLKAKVPALVEFDKVSERFGIGHWKITTFSPIRIRGDQSVYLAYPMPVDRVGHIELVFIPGHCVHVSVEDETKVAYFKDVRDLMADRLTRTTPGRYLQKFYGYLGVQGVKQHADYYLEEHTPIEVKFARSESEVVRVYTEGPSSCMAGLSYRGHLHPAAIYGHDDHDTAWAPDTEVLYFEKNGEIKARVVCNRHSKKCARIYGDVDKMYKAMGEIGYESVSNALVGSRVRRIEDDNGNGYLMAYIDAGTGSGGGNLNFKYESDRYWMVGHEGTSSYVGYERNGVTSADEDDDDTQECGHCGDWFDNEEMTYVEYHDRLVCQHCLDNEYVEAYNSTRSSRRDWMERDSVIYCEDTDDYYSSNDVAAWHDVYECQLSGYYRELHNLVMTDMGYVSEDRAIQLDHEDADGNDYAAYTRDVVSTDKGETIHRDVASVNPLTGGWMYDEDDEALTLSALYEPTYMFTTEDFLDNMTSFGRFYILGSTLMVLRDRPTVERGGIPLTEALKHWTWEEIKSGFRATNMDGDWDDAVDQYLETLDEEEELIELAA